MSLVSRIARGVGIAEGPTQNAVSSAEFTIEQLFDGLIPEGTESGEFVSPEKAITLPPVFKAIRLISETSGALPLKSYHRSNGKREERDGDDPTYYLLHNQPNESENAVQFWTRAFAHFEGWGATFIGKERAGRSVRGLHLIEPRRMRIERRGDGSLRFYETRHNGQTQRWDSRDIIYIPIFTIDGVTPLSPIGLQRETLGLPLSMRKQAAHLFRDDSTPGGVLRIKEEIKNKEVKDRLRKEWNDRHRARRDIAVLDAGAEYQQVSISLADAQYIELTGATRTDVADIFNMPASLLGGSAGDSLTYGNRVQDVQSFLTFTLHNPLKKFELALSNDPDLFPDRRNYCEFLRDDLLQPDPKGRADIYRLALDPKFGWMDRDEVRARENLPASGQQNALNQGDL